MNWKYYNLMSNEDKEEYDYKFDEPTMGFKSINLTIFLICFSLCNIVMMALIVLILNSFLIIDYEVYIVNWMKAINNIFLVMTYFILFSIFVDILGMMFFILNRGKWLEEKGYKVKFAEFDLEESKKRLKKNV